MSVAVVTDSASQIPPALASRLGVEVVPILVTIDGIDYREGVDLTPADFWARFAGGELPDVATCQPNPGDIAAIYSRVAAEADEILSIHVGGDVSGTVNSARNAAAMVDVPVHVVDSGTASFGVSACVWEACDRLESGMPAADVANAIAELAPSVGTSFILQALDFARRGGRLQHELPEGAEGVMVLAGYGTALDIAGVGRSVDELCDLMAAPFLADGRPVRVAVGEADPATIPFVEGLEERLMASELVVDLVRYLVGPSIAAHTGPGTAGGFWWPAEA